MLLVSFIVSLTTRYLFACRDHTDESDDEPFSMEDEEVDSCLPTSNIWKGTSIVSQDSLGELRPLFGTEIFGQATESWIQKSWNLKPNLN